MVSNVPVKANIVLLDETRRPSVPGHGRMPSGSTVASASESEEITLINKQISELAARKRHLKSNLNPNQGKAQMLRTERGTSNQGTRPRLEEFPELPPMVASSAGDRDRDRRTTRPRESRAEVFTREIRSQSARRGSRPSPSAGIVTGKIPRN